MTRLATILLVFLMACLFGIAYAEPVPPPAPAPPGFWEEFYGAAKTAGWFGTLIMGVMWWRAERRAEIEREDRKELQAVKDRQTEETIRTMSTVANTLDATQKIVDKIVAGFDAMKDMLRDLQTARKDTR